ncbi:MAG: hypothetical protein AAFY54_05955 [Cyanobacteria bacterium J06648_10]
MFWFFRAFLNLFRRSPAPANRLPPSNPSDNRPDTQPDTQPDTSMPSENQPAASSRSLGEHLSPQNNKNRPSSFENLKPVLNVLRAYTVTFGRPDAALDLRAVVGAIVANIDTVSIENSQLEGFMDEVIAAYDSLGMESSFVDVTAQLLAEQASVWLKEQKATVTNVVSAYLQQFADSGETWEPNRVLNLVQTVIATLNDGSLSKSGGRSLVNKVIDTFELDQALGRWVAPEWIALAQRVASYVEKGDLQSTVQSIAWSYVQQFQAILSPQLLEQIIERGPLNLSPAEVLSGDLNEFSNMLYYKFQLLEADPVVTKSEVAIAADVHKAIKDFKQRNKPNIDVTKGIQTGDLEISSPFTRTD